MDVHNFQPFGVSHACAVAVTLVAGILLVRMQCSSRIGESWKQGAARILAVLLVLTTIADPVVTWMRFSPQDPELARRLIHENAWPVHFCDIAAWLCAISLVWKNQRVAELAYLWGLTGTMQGLITPALRYDWQSPEYWGFFLQHGGVPVAGLMLALGMGLPPQAGAPLRATLWGMGFLSIAGAVNWCLSRGFPDAHPNYGFVCAKPATGSALDFLGPWPWYVFSLIGIAYGLFYLLCLPWRGKHETVDKP